MAKHDVQHLSERVSQWGGWMLILLATAGIAASIFMPH
jgi:hypothetical protein